MSDVQTRRRQIVDRIAELERAIVAKLNRMKEVEDGAGEVITPSESSEILGLDGEVVLHRAEKAALEEELGKLPPEDPG